ncbi:MAG: YnjH family protein [Gammaproteobacteria bacterium]|nr:YnjH family protein [Gammaproteobacteria bacterium]
MSIKNVLISCIGFCFIAISSQTMAYELGTTTTETRGDSTTTSDLTGETRRIKDCYYHGLRYSSGSVINDDGGSLVQCVDDHWELK